MGSGTILREVMQSDLLRDDFKVNAGLVERDEF